MTPPWARLADRLMTAIGGPVETARFPVPALVFAFVTRVVQALGIAVLFSYSTAEGLLAGAAVGGLACLGFVLPLMVGQAAFGPPWGPWPRFLAGTPEVLVLQSCL